MCYVHNQWYDISCATLYHHLFQTENSSIFPTMYFYVACNLKKKNRIISLNSTNGFVFVVKAQNFL